MAPIIIIKGSTHQTKILAVARIKMVLNTMVRAKFARKKAIVPKDDIFILQRLIILITMLEVQDHLKYTSLKFKKMSKRIILFQLLNRISPWTLQMDHLINNFFVMHWSFLCYNLIIWSSVTIFLQESNLTNLGSKTTHDSQARNAWYMDTGASHQLTNESSMLLGASP